jgi:hypothetical protein
MHMSAPILLSRQVDGYRVAFCLVLIAALFLHLTPHWSGFWLDELYTVYFANPDVPFSKPLLWQILDDPQPFPYYLSMWGWHSLVGVAEWSSRIVGGVVLAACLFATAFVLRPALPPRASTLIVAVLAFSWAGVQFSHEARSYALLYGFSCLGYALLIRSLLVGPTARVTWGMIFTALLAGAVHYYGMVLGCALFLGRAVGLWRSGQNRLAKRDLYRVLALAVFYAALLFPQLHSLADRAGGEFWIRNDPVQLLKGYLSLFTFGYAGKIGLVFLVAGAFLGVRQCCRASVAFPAYADAAAPLSDHYHSAASAVAGADVWSWSYCCGRCVWIHCGVFVVSGRRHWVFQSSERQLVFVCCPGEHGRQCRLRHSRVGLAARGLWLLFAPRTAIVCRACSARRALAHGARRMSGGAVGSRSRWLAAAATPRRDGCETGRCPGVAASPLESNGLMPMTSSNASGSYTSF